MDRAYWEEKGSAYDQEIFDVYAADRTGILTRRLRQYARLHPAGRAADLGCGTGKALPRLARLFPAVQAVDLSASCAAAARRTARLLPGVSVRRGDLAARPRLLPADLILCVNVLIMPADFVRRAIWNTLARTLAPGGHALVVVPSLESALWAAHRLHEWERRDGRSPAQARRSLARLLPGLTSPDIARGILPIDGVPTKHYLQEEFAPIAHRIGLACLRFDRIEYEWDSEFHHPPSWMQDARPWDWLCIFHKPISSKT
jgi:SAM-dependent methyltransferase